MTKVDEIIAERDAAIAIVNQQIVAANELKNSGKEGMDDAINRLVAQRAHIAAQAYEAALDDPSMTRALAALKAVTRDMNAVAQNMMSAAAFLTHVNQFIAAANQIIPLLKGG